MGQQATSAFIIVILIILMVFAVVVIPRFFVKRAVRQVVAMFRKRGAISPDTATTLRELGLIRAGAFDRMFRLRDYKPYATRLLGQANIIQSNEDGTVYLSEAELERSPVRKFAGME